MIGDVWRGELVKLRAVEPADWEEHWQWDGDNYTTRKVDSVPFPRSREQARRWAERKSQAEPEGDAFFFEIEDLHGTHVGAISTHECNRVNGTFKYGLAIKQTFRKRGFAGEAIRLVISYYFQELRYQKVCAHVYVFNEPSLALHDKLGFTREGRLRRMIYSGGAFHDEVIFGMTIEEFNDLYPQVSPFSNSNL